MVILVVLSVTMMGSSHILFSTFKSSYYLIVTPRTLETNSRTLEIMIQSTFQVCIDANCMSPSFVVCISTVQPQTLMAKHVKDYCVPAGDITVHCNQTNRVMTVNVNQLPEGHDITEKHLIPESQVLLESP